MGNSLGLQISSVLGTRVILFHAKEFLRKRVCTAMRQEDIIQSLKISTSASYRVQMVVEIIKYISFIYMLCIPSLKLISRLNGATGSTRKAQTRIAHQLGFCLNVELGVHKLTVNCLLNLPGSEHCQYSSAGPLIVSNGHLGGVLAQTAEICALEWCTDI